MSPWERRQRGGRYYTRSRKVGGRAVREYLGTGPLAELAAETHAHKRLRREQAAKAWRQQQEDLQALDRPVEELHEVAEELARAARLAAGYHQHNRGEWTKKRPPKGPPQVFSRRPTGAVASLLDECCQVLMPITP